MDVIRPLELDEQRLDDSPLFTGPATSQVADDTETGYRVGLVRFGRGVRNHFHTHSQDQILVVTEGKGIVATSDDEVHVGAGDIVIAPAGERHWHGAAPGETFAHVTILATPSQTEWEVPEQR